MDAREYPTEWPENGLRSSDLGNEVTEVVDGITSLYDQERVPFCFPGTSLDAKDLARIVHLLPKQLNALGTHTRTQPAEDGFKNIQQIEASAVRMVASLVDGRPDEVDGYFCGGATEANDMGLWIGREYLRKHPDPMNRGVVVLCTTLTHYSIHKAAAKLDIGMSSWRQCHDCGEPHAFVPDPRGSGVTFVGMNERGEMDVKDLERIFQLKYEEGFRRFIVVPTVGTTVFGSIDPVTDIARVTRDFERSTNAHCYIHVDAAFGGFTVPFVNPELAFGFNVSGVMSVAFDGDKMGRLPYPAGIFLCRKHLQNHVQRQVAYIGGGHQDDTSSGSRSAVASVYAWMLFQLEGRNKFREYVDRCLVARNRLKALFRQRFSTWTVIHPCSPYVNILPVELHLDRQKRRVPVPAKEGTDEFKDPRQEALRILKPYILASDYFPANPMDPQSCPRIVYKLCIMNHNAEEGRIDRFVNDLEEAHRIWNEKSTPAP